MVIRATKLYLGYFPAHRHGGAPIGREHVSIDQLREGHRKDKIAAGYRIVPTDVLEDSVLPTLTGERRDIVESILRWRAARDDT